MAIASRDVRREGRGGMLLRGGLIVDSLGERRGDLLLEEGTIVAVGDAASFDLQNCLELDVDGCIVAPGLVDAHTHLRQPGREEAETIASGTRAAVKGGFTAVAAMPNTDPVTDSEEHVRGLMRIVDRDAVCQVVPVGAITQGLKGVALVPFDEMVKEGVRYFSDDGYGVQDDNVMRRACEYATMFDVLLGSHCEVSDLVGMGTMHEGKVSSELGIMGISPLAEELMVMREIALAEVTGCRVHLMHVSTARGLELFAEAKARGVRVSAEIAPHHFSLSEEQLRSFDPLFKVNPPLRPEADRLACVEALRSGLVDVIATDHAPHVPHTKDRVLEEAPPGMLGLETALGLSRSVLRMSWEATLAALSWNPAKLLAVDVASGGRQGGPLEVGGAANLVVIDPDAEWTVDVDKMESKSRNCPYGGMKLRGKVRHTLVEGVVVVENGNVCV